MAAEPALTQDRDFAAIAVELRIGELKVAELSFAAAILSMIRADNLYNLERVAIECGIESHIARQIILDERRFTALIADADRLFKTMIPHEAAIRAIITKGAEGLQCRA